MIVTKYNKNNSLEVILMKWILLLAKRVKLKSYFSKLVKPRDYLNEEVYFKSYKLW